NSLLPILAYRNGGIQIHNRRRRQLLSVRRQATAAAPAGGIPRLVNRRAIRGKAYLVRLLDRVGAVRTAFGASGARAPSALCPPKNTFRSPPSG
ncbi:MAG: hypothetical protein NT090_06810, partial [Acidobacteria bacterium]|nr:hypothetical protein [Acidobacteriota bacterium]